MDLIAPIAFFLALLIFQPGNKELNEYCTKAVNDGTFQSRIECWNYYKDYRDFPQD